MTPKSDKREVNCKKSGNDKEIKTGQRLRFAVIDSGIGIKHEDFSKLFKVFGKIT